jgi:hypothetical protein
MRRHLPGNRSRAKETAYVSSGPVQNGYNAAGYGYPGNNILPPQLPSMTPPPPYEALNPTEIFQHSPPIPEYGAPYYSQQYLPVARPDALQFSQRAWASTSNIDVGRPPAQGWAHEQVRPRSANSGQRHGANAAFVCPIARGLNQGAAVCDWVATRLNDALSRADGGATPHAELEAMTRALEIEEEEPEHHDNTLHVPGEPYKPAKESKSKHRILNWDKSWLYANSRLPPGMIPFNIYLPTWTLICRAAQAAIDVYERPSKTQRDNYTDADPKKGTKATVIKSQPIDDRKLLIVAIRGSQWNFFDWAVNFAIAPTEPTGFLDDEGNACHAGFLEVARAMIKPIAAQLRRLIEEDPSWVTSSLMFTGHSAGGAVANLLYAHMMSSVTSELTVLAGVFKRIHCVTFGVPPISLLPLQIPHDKTDHKNQFLSFVNEGDPVTRLDRPYGLSLIKLLAEPAPNTGGRPGLRQKLSRQKLRTDQLVPSVMAQPRWPVPDATLSNPGRLVLLREKPGSKSQAVEATQLTDEQLRNGSFGDGVLFGDVRKHWMTLYKERLDLLAFAAISGRDIG